MKEKNLTNFREFSAFDPLSKSKRVHFQFYANPVEILGAECVEGLRLERTQVKDGHAAGTGEFFEIPCGLVIAAIGYRADRMDGAPYDEARGIIPNQEGKVEPGLYVVGWIKRGPSGVISSNRPDGEIVAKQIHEDFAPDGDPPKTGRQGLEQLLNQRDKSWINFDDWQRLEALEEAAADEAAPRRKFVTVEDMLDALNADEGESNNE